MTADQPWYKTTHSIKGPLLFIEDVDSPKYGETCTIRVNDQTLEGQVLETTENEAVIQVFGKTMGLDKTAEVQFSGSTAKVGVGPDMLGKTFDGRGNPRGSTAFKPEQHLDINGSAINPASRKTPDEFIQTGISAIDSMAPLVQGQKLPIFSQAGLPHNELAAQLVRQADIPGEKLAIVFAAMGITQEEARFFQEEFAETGASERTVSFLNLADDPSVERIMTPRVALTTAEYLAFEHDYNVVAVLTDFTNYCESLREISSARNEVPGRRGYPGYMYTDLAANYERAGVIEGKSGSVTQIPILTMPSGDKTHPVPDLTGYITEGQIVLEDALQSKGIEPPINPLPSLSRLKPDDEYTRDDHGDVADQLYAAYARSKELRELVAVIGEGSLSETDQKFLRFGETFEEEFLDQGRTTNRDLNETLDTAWNCLHTLPRDELNKVGSDILDKYYAEQ